MGPAKCGPFLSSPSLLLYRLFCFFPKLLLNDFGANKIIDMSYLERDLMKNFSLIQSCIKGSVMCKIFFAACCMNVILIPEFKGNVRKWEVDRLW